MGKNSGDRLFPVEERPELISDAGQTIRVAVSGISVQAALLRRHVFRVDDG
jgi:hypothetical protein